MYCQYYGFKEKPFNVTSDPAFFFQSKKHQEALSHLSYGVTQRKGIVVLTGEIGTGKTTLCRYFLNMLGKDIKTALILNPYFSEVQLLEAIIADFGLEARGRSKIKLVAALNNFLLKESEAKNNVVLIIDESQNLSPRHLEQIRLLSNLETEKEKLLQIVLVGQPELNATLDLYKLRQIRQRITVRSHIGALDQEEVKNYINHRLVCARADRPVAFTDDAIRAIWEFSKGTPRLINHLCDRALLASFVRETNIIDAVSVELSTVELKPLLLGCDNEHNT